MSDVTCHDHFICSWTSHGSCIHFRVHIRVCIVSYDMIEHGMTWKEFFYVHMALTFAWDS